MQEAHQSVWVSKQLQDSGGSARGPASWGTYCFPACLEILALFPTESPFRLRGGMVSASDSWLCWVPPMIACQGWWARCQLLSCGGHCGYSREGSSVTTEELHRLWEVGLKLVPAVRERTTQGCEAQRNDNVQCLNRKVDQSSAWYLQGGRGWY